MQCYEFGETIKRGISVTYPYGLLLRCAEEDATIQIPLADDTRAWLSSVLQVVPEGMRFLFTRAGFVLEEGRPPQIETAHYSNVALILIHTQPGEGGTIEYRHNHLIEPAFRRDRDIYDACLDRLFIARPGGFMRIKRTGELEGLPSELTLGWDGRWLDDLRKAKDQTRPIQRTSPMEEPPARPIKNALVRLSPAVPSAP